MRRRNSHSVLRCRRVALAAAVRKMKPSPGRPLPFRLFEKRRADIGVFDLAGDAQKVRLRQINERLADEGEIERHFGALIPARSLDDLHQNFVPLFEIAHRAAARAVVACKARRALVEREIAVARHAAVDERRLHAGHHVGDLALIDVAEHGAVLFVLALDLHELAVFGIDDDLFPADAVKKPFLLHCTSAHLSSKV